MVPFEALRLLRADVTVGSLRSSPASGLFVRDPFGYLLTRESEPRVVRELGDHFFLELLRLDVQMAVVRKWVCTLFNVVVIGEDGEGQGERPASSVSPFEPVVGVAVLVVVEEFLAIDRHSYNPGTISGTHVNLS